MEKERSWGIPLLRESYDSSSSVGGYNTILFSERGDKEILVDHTKEGEDEVLVFEIFDPKIKEGSQYKQILKVETDKDPGSLRSVIEIWEKIKGGVLEESDFSLI